MVSFSVIVRQTSNICDAVNRHFLFHRDKLTGARKLAIRTSVKTRRYLVWCNTWSAVDR